MQRILFIFLCSTAAINAMEKNLTEAQKRFVNIFVQNLQNSNPNPADPYEFNMKVEYEMGEYILSHKDIYPVLTLSANLEIPDAVRHSAFQSTCSNFDDSTRREILKNRVNR